MTIKLCKWCGENKCMETDFYFNSNTGRFASPCRTCVGKRNKAKRNGLSLPPKAIPDASTPVSKVCRVCNEEKPLEAFHKGDGPGQRTHTCRLCSSAAYAKRHGTISRLLPLFEKQCPICQETKPLDEFSKTGSKRGRGYRAECKPCYATQVRKHRANLRESDPSRYVCISCGQHKDPTEFARWNDQHRTRLCQECKRQQGVMLGELRRSKMPQTKICQRCNEELPRSAFYGSQAQGIRAYCQTCYRFNVNEYRRQRTELRGRKVYFYAITMDDSTGVQSRKCSKCMVTKELVKFRYEKKEERYSARCLDCERQEARARYHADVDLAIARAKSYRQRNPEKVKAATKRWRNNHYQQVLEHIARRRARQMNAPVVEVIDRDRIIARDSGTCYLCGRKPTGYFLTLDHVIPLVRNGNHTAANLRVACRSCNSWKNDRLLTELNMNECPGLQQGDAA